MIEYVVISVIYGMFCLGVGLRYSFEVEGFSSRVLTLFLVSVFAPLVLGYDITRKILSK